MSANWIDVRHSFTYNGVRINIYHANKGDGLPMHGHEYSHATMCATGSCLVSLENGKNKVLTKHEIPLNLLAGVQHEIEALEDNTVFLNVFAEEKY